MGTAWGARAASSGCGAQASLARAQLALAGSLAGPAGLDVIEMKPPAPDGANPLAVAPAAAPGAFAERANPRLGVRTHLSLPAARAGIRPRRGHDTAPDGVRKPQTPHEDSSGVRSRIQSVIFESTIVIRSRGAVLSLAEPALTNEKRPRPHSRPRPPRAAPARDDRLMYERGNGRGLAGTPDGTPPQDRVAPTADRCPEVPGRNPSAYWVAVDESGYCHWRSDRRHRCWVSERSGSRR